MQVENKKICEYFIRGNCRYGNKCHNLHEFPKNFPNNPMQKPFGQFHNQKSSICTFFLKNSCTRKNCPFFHGYDNNLQHVKTYINEKEINNLIKVDEKEFIACDEQAFIVRFSDNPEEVKKSLNKEGYKIGKMIFSGNKMIFGLKKNE